MADDLPALAALVAFPAIPSATLIFVLASRGTVRGWPLPRSVHASLSVSLIAAATAAVLLAFDETRTTLAVPLGTWFVLPHETPLRVDLTLRADLASLGFGAAIAAVALMSSIHHASREADRERRERFAIQATAAFSTAAIALLFDDLLLFFAFWQASALAASLPAATTRSRFGVGAQLAPAFRLAADVFLASALFRIWSWSGSLSLSRICERADIAGSESETIGCLLFATAAARCVQLPFLPAARPASGTCGEAIAITQCVAGWPLGIVLLWRTFPLWNGAETTSFAFGALGAGTLLAASVVAIAQVDARRSLSFLAAGQFAWMLIGLAVGEAFGRFGAATLLVVHGFAQASLLMSTENGSGDGTGRVGSRSVPLSCAVLATGCWGQHAVLTALWGRAGDDRFAQGVFWTCAAGLVLSSFGYFRLVFRSVPSSSAGGGTSSGRTGPAGSPTGRLPAWSAAGAAFATGVIATAVALGHDGLSQQGLGFDPFVITVTSLLAALGVVGAWMSASHGGSGDRRFGPADAVAHEARNLFGLRRLWGLVLAVPLRCLTGLAKIADRWVIDGGAAAAARIGPAVVTRLTAPWQTGRLPMDAIAVLLAVGSLAVVLLALAG